MVKKLYKSLLTLIVLLLLSVGNNCYAAENYKVWNNGSIANVNENKTWTVTFNKNVDVNSIKGSIKVYELDNNQPVEIKIENSGSNSVKVSPENSYVTGKNYVLVVDDALKSTSGKQLKQGVKYNFTIDGDSSQDEIPIENYDQYYSALKNALANYKSKLVLNIENYNRDTYDLNVINDVLYDNPNLRDWYLSAEANLQGSGPVKMIINFNYSDTKQNLIEKDNEIQNKVDEIVKNVTNPSMKDYQKELALHDYVVRNANYDNSTDVPNDSYTSYGVLIKGVGVCEGYADAMDRLLTAAGIECRMVTGKANGGSGWVDHAWNIVKIQGEYYHLDSTWDDPIMGDGSHIISHSYFNVTDSKMARSHIWDTSKYPRCNSNDYSFGNIISK
ncbi:MULTISPECIES: transglutaminase domain-containing protein [Clostridium]|uniref:Transglutaminase domain-containing protein n=1 Tax=Clostridium lapidicellarium TaxID=3240931 RepID=A0ABV4DV34_9CLOT|nr:transglutaminase domain-containing protein [uncultured Clostridium sp.]